MLAAGAHPPMDFRDGNKNVRHSVQGVFCLIVLCGILWAGLYPFTAHPPNEVRWSANPRGLRFGDYGMILASGMRLWPSRKQGPCSVEIWLQPGLIGDSNTFLAFYTPELSIPFSVHQWTSNIALIRQMHDSEGDPTRETMLVRDALSKDQSSVIAITSDGQHTAVYVNGNLVDSSSSFRLRRSDLTSEFELGNSPTANDSWSGVLRGFALYGRALSATEVLDDYRNWTTAGRPRYVPREAPVAVYLFKEGAGNVIHSAISSGPDIYIPKYYGYHGEKFLAPPWEEFSFSKGYLKDVVINVGGFVPFGFFFYAYFLTKRNISHPALLAILFGAAISLMIEVLQGYMPTRDSGMTDVVTNTIGTALGVELYLWETLRSALVAAGILVGHKE